MRVTPLEPMALAHIIGNLREWDRREVFATRADDCEDTLLADAMSTGMVSWVGWDDAEPIAAFGCMPLWKGVWSLWLFATDKFDKIGMSVTKMIVRDIVPAMWNGGAHRLECKSMEGHVTAQRWLQSIGAKRECTHARFGREGQDFHVYTWERP